MPCAEVWAETFLNPSTLFYKEQYVFLMHSTSKSYISIHNPSVEAVPVLLSALHYKNCQNFALHIFQTFVQAFSIFEYIRVRKMAMLF